MCIPHWFIHSSMDGHLSCFHFWLLWTMLLWPLVFKYMFKSLLLILLGIYPKSELLDHMVILQFLRDCHTIFHGSCTIWHAHQQCTRVPISSYQHLLLLAFFICQQMWSDISLWFWFTIPWCLVMLNIFSYTPWPFVWLCVFFGKNIKFLCSFFNEVVCYWVVCVLYILLILNSYQVYNLKYFFPFCPSFSFYWCLPLLSWRFCLM